ncbi:MAG: glycosyltransferase family 9 protein [SAR324 cluster bacterium]|nr:glycosyltransferase family 9 protein [SAR324 cluster bacterium]
MATRILLTQLRRIGDVLMTTPAVRALRQAMPDAHIDYLTEAPSHQILATNPHIDEVLVWPRKGGLPGKLRMVGRLRAAHYDVMVDFFSNPTSALITRITNAPRRIGFAFRVRRWAYTDALPLPDAPYAASHKLALLAPLGVAPGSLLPELHVDEASRRHAGRQLADLGIGTGDFLVALSPVSRRDYRVWPARHYARLADMLIERYAAKVLFLWGPGEQHFVDAVRQHMVHKPLPDYPVPSLMETAALLERANLLVANNNGPRHMAIAVGTPTVGVFGRSHPESWTPPDAPRHAAVAYDPGCKDQCVYPRCGRECINDVPYPAVAAEVERLSEALLKDGTPV